MWKVAPLKSSFMLASILGLLITSIYTFYGRISTDWGFTLALVFAIMLVASMISMRNAPIEDQIAMSPDLLKGEALKKKISVKKKPKQKKKK